MKLHKRTSIVGKAHIELQASLCHLSHKHDLTPAEMIRILSEEIQGLCKYLIRKERHPNNPEKKGDEE